MLRSVLLSFILLVALPHSVVQAAGLTDVLSNVLHRLLDSIKGSGGNQTASQLKSEIETIVNETINEDSTSSVTSYETTTWGTPSTTEQESTTSTWSTYPETASWIWESSTMPTEHVLTLQYLSYYGIQYNVECSLTEEYRHQLVKNDGFVDVYSLIFDSKVLERLQFCALNTDVDLSTCMAGHWGPLRSLPSLWSNGANRDFCPLVQCLEEKIDREIGLQRHTIDVVDLALSSLCSLNPSAETFEPLDECILEILKEANVMMAAILSTGSGGSYPKPCFKELPCKDSRIDSFTNGSLLSRHTCDKDVGLSVNVTDTIPTSDATTPSMQPSSSTTIFELITDKISNEKTSTTTQDHLQDNGHDFLEGGRFKPGDDETEETNYLVSVAVPTCAIALFGCSIFLGMYCLRRQRRIRYRREAVGYEEVKDDIHEMP